MKEKRIDEVNRMLKEWEQKFDEEQKKKEEELIRKFYGNTTDLKSTNEKEEKLHDKINENEYDETLNNKH